MKQRIFLSVIFLFFSLLSLSAKENVIIKNPVFAGDRPDPSIFKIGEEYWATATSNEWSPLFPIFRSVNLVDWELVNYVFPKGAPDWAYTNFWAPELSYDEKQGKIYVHYTARDKESNYLSCAVAVADSPMGEFRDLGVLVAQELGSIDGFEFRDTDGKLYFLWKEDGNSKGRETFIWAQQMNEERTKLIGNMYPILRNDEVWEQSLIEGVCVFKRGDYYYATYSAGACCEKECSYKTGIARSKNLLYGWEKNPQNPILQDNDDWYCAGHGTLVSDGENDYFLYHAYNKQGSVYVGRQGVMQKMYWDESTKWPYFVNNITYNRDNASLDYTDRFNGERLSPIWQWNVRQFPNIKTGKDGLMIGACSENMGTLLVQPIKSLNFSMLAQVDCSKSTAETGIGLIGASDNAFGAPIAGVGISATKNGVIIWETVKGKTSVIANVDIPQKNAKISMTLKDGYLLDFSYESKKKMTPILQNFDASKYVPWGMGFRVGLVSKGEDGSVSHIKEVKIKN